MLMRISDCDIISRAVLILYEPPWCRSLEISRRRFLSNTLKGATLLAAGQLELQAFGQESEAGVSEITPSVVPKPFSILRPNVDFRGRIVKLGDGNYERCRENYNARILTRPEYIFYCSTPTDVVHALEFARQENTPFVIRAGGHSYEGLSLVEGGIVIDVSEMNKVSVQTTKKLAVVEAGAKLMQLYEQLWDKRMVVPGGSCASVGVAGLTLGGGFGLLSRYMGLTCDNLKSVKMVNAQGEILEANQHENEDLLWALKGAGAGNFGVVTELTFKLHPISNVTIFRIKWNWEEMGQVIHTWQKWAPHVDDRITSILTMTSKFVNRVSCVGVFLGSQAEVRSLINPLITSVKPISVSLSTVPFIDAARRFSGEKRPSAKSGAVPEAVHIPIHPRFKNSSDYAIKDLSESALKTIHAFLSSSPRDSSCLQFDSYGGAINRVPISDSAFCHRGETKFCLHYQINWRHPSEDERNMKWISEFRRAMQPHVSGQNYFNYCDLNTENYASSYFGDNLTKLQAVKVKYDPDDVFRYPQSLKVDNGTTSGASSKKHNNLLE